jgi:hypothetical protein
MASGQHQPLNRQSERFVREGVDISLSTFADLIGHARELAERGCQGGAKQLFRRQSATFGNLACKGGFG